MVMPFSRSRSMLSMTRSFTDWFSRNTPLCQSMASTSVVLPWSTWAMMAMLRICSRTAIDVMVEFFMVAWSSRMDLRGVAGVEVGAQLLPATRALAQRIVGIQRHGRVTERVHGLDLGGGGGARRVVHRDARHQVIGTELLAHRRE